MSFIQQTIQCPCGKFMNIATGTFGFGYPKKCSYCGKTEKFELIKSGWHADEDGGWIAPS